MARESGARSMIHQRRGPEFTRRYPERPLGTVRPSRSRFLLISSYCIVYPRPATDETMITLGKIQAGQRAARALALALLVAGAAVSLPLPSAAADKSLGTFKAWSAMSFAEDDKTVCMMWSQPEKAEGDYTKRGEIFVFVTHRPGDHEMNKVSFETGYTFKEKSEVRVVIDGESYTLYTDGSTAWSYEPKDDSRMVNAMRAGSTMIVEGVSSRGTQTRDTYSLSGFTAAHNAINKACKPK